MAELKTRMLDEGLGKQFGVEDTFGRYRNISWDLSPLRRRYLEEKYDLTQKRMMNILRYNLTGALKYDLLNTIAKPRTVDLNAIGSKGCSIGTSILPIRNKNGREQTKMLVDIYKEKLCEKGFEVFSFNMDKGIMEWKPFYVVDNGIKKIIGIETQSGESTKVTSNHPFLVRRKSSGTRTWVNASKLSNSDEVGIAYDTSGYWDWNKIKHVTPFEEERTYGLKVMDNHSHVIDNIISHNSGKSVLLLKLHEEHYRKLYDIPATEKLDGEDIMYIIERVFFIQDYLIRYVKQNPKLNTTCLQLDERAQTLGDSSYANMKRITNLTETLRKRKINFFYASPKLRWNFEYEYVIEPLEINDEYKILHSVIFDKDMRLLGSLYTKKCDDHLETEYEKIKEEFMTAVSEGKLRTLEYEDMAFGVLEAFPEIEEMYNESSEYEQEKQRYMMLSPKERRGMGRPMPPEERLTSNKLIYCINKVNADYTGTEKVMIMEEIKHILHNRKMEKKGKAAAPNIKLIKEAAKDGTKSKGCVVELDDGTYESEEKEEKGDDENVPEV